MFFGFNPFSFTLNFLVIQVSGYFMSAANSYYSSMNFDFGISLIAKKKEYGFFLCLLIRAFVIPLRFDFTNAISYLLSVHLLSGIPAVSHRS